MKLYSHKILSRYFPRISAGIRHYGIYERNGSLLTEGLGVSSMDSWMRKMDRQQSHGRCGDEDYK